MSRFVRRDSVADRATTEPAPAMTAGQRPQATRSLRPGLCRVKALRSVLADGMPYQNGDVFVCREATGNALLNKGWAELVD